MNKSPIDEMNENEITDVEKNRADAMESIQSMNDDMYDEIQSAQADQSTGVTSNPSPENKTPPQQEQKLEKPEQQAEEGKPEKYGFLPRGVAEFTTAPGAGVADFAVGSLNMLGKAIMRDLDVPQIPTLTKFESKEAQVVRDLSSVVIPSVVLGGYASQGAKAFQAARGAKLGRLGKLGNDIAFKKFAETGLAGGTGAAVDYVAPVNSEDLNALGEMKKAWPQTWGWVSDDFAALDSDSPEIKRQKNMKEGVLLSIVADILVAGAKLILDKRGVQAATSWIPENEQAKAVTDRLNANKAKIKTPEDEIAAAAEKRIEELQELGDYGVSKSVDLDEKPIFGYHDLYDDVEMGMRTADDGGVLAASVDLVRIEGNIDTVYGRLGSVFTEGALQFAADNEEGAMVLIKGLGEQLTGAGRYGYTTSNGRYLSFAEISEAGDNLAASMMNMDVATMKRALAPLSQVDLETGATILTSDGYNAAFKAINKYLKEYATLDQAKAYAYASASLAGQVSDMAEGARLVDGSRAMVRAQEEILDRIEFLMTAKAQTSYVRGRALNMTNVWNRTKNWTKDKFKQMSLMAEAEMDEVPAALREKAAEAKQTIETLRNIQKERPQMLGPLMLAYEVTDGNIHSMTKLNEYIRNSTGMLSKAFFDARSDMPSAWTQGVWANIYNSVLSSLVTPIKAGASNAAIMIERPIATFVGAAINGDKKTIRRGLYQYGAFVDTFTSAYSHMNEVFKRASKDPSSVGYVMRDDIARKNSQQMEILNAHADAAEEMGELGPAAIVGHIEELNALSEHPWLRFGPNAMTAFDGFTRSVIGSVEARGRAYDMINASNGALDADMMDDIAKQTYNQMFDKNGMITDKAVEHASREIAMNLDNNASEALSELLRDAPAFKPFMMFPRTSMNMALFAGSHNPLGLLPASKFQNAVHQFSRKFEEMPLKDVEDLLTKRGIPYDSSNIEVVYNNIAAEMKGRKAIGALSVFTAGGMFMADRLHGNGHFDKETQRVRRDADWQPKSYKGLDGRWYSYADLGPVSDWIALTADVMDNLVDGTLTPRDGQDLMNKLGFVLSASVTSKSLMAGLEPMNDVFAGNPAALARWGASFGSGLAPLSGLRNDLSRLMTPQLKEVEQEITSLIANRNPISKEGLANKYDYIDGGLVGVPSNWTRIWNTFTPWKVSDSISPEKQFLIDIEFDGRPTLSTNGKGVDLTEDQKSAIAQKMGEQGEYKKAIQAVMNGKDGKEFRRSYKEGRQAEAALDVGNWDNVHYELHQALRTSIRFAIDSLDEEMKNEINNQQYAADLKATAARRGDVEQLRRLQKYNNY